MNRLQSEILKIFKEYKRICDENKLTYFAIGGTCIGAVRHNGFIPWDDDLDVAMPLDDYNQFIEIARTELKYPYELYDYREHQHCSFRFVKVHNVDTTFIESKAKRFPERFTGIYIDIMPISGITKNEIEQKKYLFKCFFNRKLDYVCRFQFSEIDTWKTKLFSVIAYPLTRSKKYNFYSYSFDEMLQRYDYSHENDVFFSWRLPLEGNYKNVFPYSIFESAVELPFEDTTICVPVDYDGYLSRDFGNYMKLPPEEKQIPLHDYAVLEFNKPYTAYKNPVE